MQRKHEFIENPTINAIYIRELDTLITNINPESRNGMIFYYPEKSARAYI